MRAENVQTEMVAKTRLLDQVLWVVYGLFGSIHSYTVTITPFNYFCSPVQTRQRVAGCSAQSGREQVEHEVITITGSVTVGSRVPRR